MIRTLAIAAVVVALLTLGTGAARAAAPTLQLSGPHTNRFGNRFSYEISGVASGAADHVVVWEQFHRRGGCASSYEAEKARTSLVAEYSITVFVNAAVQRGARYSLRARFSASHLGEHGVCAYLIDRASGHTYAHAAAWWVNVRSHAPMSISSGLSGSR